MKRKPAVSEVELDSLHEWSRAVYELKNFVVGATGRLRELRQEIDRDRRSSGTWSITSWTEYRELAHALAVAMQALEARDRYVAALYAKGMPRTMDPWQRFKRPRRNPREPGVGRKPIENGGG